MARTSEALGTPNAFDIGRILAGGQEWWKSRPAPFRKNLIVAAVVAVVVVTGLSLVVFQDPMTPVYANLSESDAGAITQVLQSDKIPYQLEGTTVLVPRSMADQVRVDLAMQGLPHQGTVGYANVLSSISLGETSSEFNLAVQNALQADLATTISSINGVHAATVAIVPQQTSAFIDQPQQSASASVFVDLEPGTTLSSRQVLGIEDLVAHAVPGLTVKNVSVTDQNGDPLSAASATADPSSTSGQLAMTQSFENTLNSQITQLLTPIVGPGNVVVETNATLNFDNTTTTQTTFQPLPSGQGVPVSNHTITETFTGTGAPPAVSGSGSNSVPTYPATGSGTGSPSTMNYQDSTIEYAVSKVNQTVTSQPYTVQGLTVSVTLNAAAYHLTSANKAALQKLIGTAIGSTSPSQTAQDVTIFASPFSRPNFPAAPAQSGLPLTELAGGGAVLLLVIGGLFFMLRRRGKKEEWSPLVPPRPETAVSRSAAEEMSVRPEEMAQVIKAWLREEPSERDSM